jgi:hypothetical protein
MRETDSTPFIRTIDDCVAALRSDSLRPLCKLMREGSLPAGLVGNSGTAKIGVRGGFLCESRVENNNAAAMIPGAGQTVVNTDSITVQSTEA